MAISWLACAEQADRDAYVYRVLQDHLGMAPDLARKTLEAVAADEEAAQADRARILAEQDDD